jgi:biopolymer transport protein TolR
MRKNKRRKPMAEINVVPYIDVTLVLLIIFMITTPMLQTGVEVNLPETESTSESQNKGEPPIIISIKSDGSYYIDLNNDGNEDKKDEVKAEEINEKIQLAIAGKKDPEVSIRADNAVDYGAVVKVMASLKAAGIEKVGLVTKPSDTQ